MILAQEFAQLHQHNQIRSIDILLGLVREDEGVAALVLKSLDLTTEKLASTNVVRKSFDSNYVPAGHIPFSPQVKEIVEKSLREALELGHSYIGTEHLLLALLKIDCSALLALSELGMDPTDVRKAAIRKLIDIQSIDRTSDVAQSVSEQSDISKRVVSLITNIESEVAELRSLIAELS